MKNRQNTILLIALASLTLLTPELEAAREDLQKADLDRRNRGTERNADRVNPNKPEKFNRNPNIDRSERQIYNQAGYQNIPNQLNQMQNDRLRKQQRQAGAFTNQNRQDRDVRGVRERQDLGKPNSAKFNQFFQDRKQKWADKAERKQIKQEAKAQFINQQRQKNDLADRTQRQIKNKRPDMRQWFDNNFFHAHNYRPVYYDARNNWWRANNWHVISGWLAWGGNAMPYYYDDTGYAYELPYNDLDSSPYSLNGGYSNQLSPGSWLPLGTFAIGSSDALIDSTNSFYQLALGRDGSIAGSYFNAATNQLHPIEGMVDRETQQAAWRVTDNAFSPIVTTGLYNLTQNAVPVTVYFAPDTVQNWLMVRIEE